MMNKITTNIPFEVRGNSIIFQENIRCCVFCGSIKKIEDFRDSKDKRYSRKSPICRECSIKFVRERDFKLSMLVQKDDKELKIKIIGIDIEKNTLKLTKLYDKCLQLGRMNKESTKEFFDYCLKIDKLYDEYTINTILQNKGNK